MVYLVIARVKSKSGVLIGYRLKNTITENIIDVPFEEISHYRLINAIIDKNNKVRAKQGCSIENVYVFDDVCINKRNTHVIGKPKILFNYSFGKLSKTQEKLIDLLKEKDRIEIDKKRENIKVTMKDLSALTAVTGLEFALFERNDKYIIFKGNSYSIYLNGNTIGMLINRKFIWVGHTHPGMSFNCLMPSDGDYKTLKALGQKKSTIYNSVGEYYVFEEDWL